MTTRISAAVEGLADEAVVRRLIGHAGGELGAVYGKEGKQALRRKLKGYDNAASHTPWLVLVDLDRSADCAPTLRRSWLPKPAPRLCFRIVVRAVEAWLMADADTLADFIGVARSRIPGDPEALAHPKESMINLARRSRRRHLRTDMVPRQGSGRAEGPAYTSRLVEYVDSAWRPNVAAQNAESLHRAMACLRRLIEGGLNPAATHA